MNVYPVFVQFVWVSSLSPKATDIKKSLTLSSLNATQKT